MFLPRDRCTIVCSDNDKVFQDVKCLVPQIKLFGNITVNNPLETATVRTADVIVLMVLMLQDRKACFSTAAFLQRKRSSTHRWVFSVTIRPTVLLYI